MDPRKGYYMSTTYATLFRKANGETKIKQKPINNRIKIITMKNAKFHTIAAVAALVALAAAAATSCQKEESVPDRAWTSSHTAYGKDAPLPFPHYGTPGQLKAELRTVMALDSLSQLLSREAAMGRRSAGCASDELCSAADPASFTDRASVLDFYRHNRGRVDTLHCGGAVVVVPRWHKTPLRYVADTNGLFAVGNTVYRLFADGLLSADISLAQQLADIDESQWTRADRAVFHCTPFAGGVLGLASAGGCWMPVAHGWTVHADSPLLVERYTCTLDAAEGLSVTAVTAMELVCTEGAAVALRTGFARQPCHAAMAAPQSM